MFKSVAFSKIAYLAFLILLLSNIIKELKHIQKRFLQFNKKVKIKHDTLCNDYKDGGSKSVDIVHENVLGYKSFTMIIFMNGKSLLRGILIDIEVNI